LSLKNKEENSNGNCGIVDEIVISNGMKKRRSCYYLEDNELMVVSIL
jgi:hypothetical protein